MTLLLKDEFDEPCAAGSVIGSRVGDWTRGGVDRATTISVDHDALRVGWLAEPGWGRAAVTYGPFTRQPGLAFMVRLLPGLPTSQIDGERPIDAPMRLVPNLAIGWYGSEQPAAPECDGAAFVVDAHDGADARLLAGTAVAVERMQNVVFDLVAVVRDRDVLYLIASHEGVAGAVPFSELRPVAVGPLPIGDEFFLGIHVRVIGEVDYRVDARIHSVRVAQLDADFAAPLVSETLRGRGLLNGSWQVDDGRIERGPRGIGLAAGRPRASLAAPGPLGLVRAGVALDAPGASGTIGTTADVIGPRVRLMAGAVALERESAEHVVSRTGFATAHAIGVGGHGIVEYADDGERTRVRIDGVDVCQAPAFVAPGADLTIAVDSPGFRVDHIEAYPPSLARPAVFALDDPWDRRGTRVVARDDFRGPRADLAAPAPEAPAWRRLFGAGRIRRDDGRAFVDATRAEPNPGRTLYAFDWDEPDFAELEMTMTAPGSARGTGHMARGGFVIWESAADYVVVNFWLDDGFHGSSVSMFVHANGSEPPWDHDATWTNCGARIQPGAAMRFRLATDGDFFFVHLDDEPVLWRRRTDIRSDAGPMAIRAVGIAANWEWGNDTGSEFRDFVARGRS